MDPTEQQGHLEAPAFQNLDHFIIEQQHLRNVNRVLTIHPEAVRDPYIRGWEEYTDHKPVEMTVRLAPPAFSKSYHTPARRIATHRGRGTSDAALALRHQYATTLNDIMSKHEGPVDWPTLCKQTTAAAATVFGYVERSPPRPWFAGRETEIKGMNRQICNLKRVFDQMTDVCSRPEASQQQHLALQNSKRALQQQKRRKIAQLKKWENQYWHDVGLQAEQAERRGDHYELYKVLSRLKLRGVAKKHIGERTFPPTQLRKPSPGDNISKPSRMERHRWPNALGTASHNPPQPIQPPSSIYPRRSKSNAPCTK